MKDLIKSRPFLFFALFMIAGIISAHILILVEFSFLAIIVFLSIIIFTVFISTHIIFYSDNDKYIKIIISVLLIFFLTGFISYSIAEYKYTRIYRNIYSQVKNNYVNLQGILCRDLGDIEGNYYYIEVEKIDYKNTADFKIKIPRDKFNHLKAGSKISCDVILSEPPDQLNPGGFSYKNHLKKRNIFFESWKIKNVKFIRQSFSVKNILIKIKSRVISSIDNLFSKNISSFLKAIMLGEKAGLNYETESLLKEAGASHLLALSGLHAGIIILSLKYIYVRLIESKKNALILITLTALLYVIIVGASVSIIRASLLILIFLWAKVFYRDGDFLNILSLTLLINLLLNPYSLFTVSLQLSYLIVVSIYLLTNFLNKVFPQIISISLSAQFGSLAIIAYYFNEYAYIAIITNLWLIPLISFLLPFSFFIVLIGIAIPPAGIVLAPIMEYCFNIMFKGLEFMRILQGDMLVLAEPKLILMILYYIILFSTPYIYRKRIIFLKAKKFRGLKIITPLVFLLIFATFFINFNSELLEVRFLAVGQGDGIYIGFPNNKNMIIDTGPPGKNGRQVEYNIIAFLNHQGIKVIDYLVITHFDADHSGGLKHLLRRKKVKNILLSKHKNIETLDYLESKAVESNDINLFYIEAGNSFDVGECYINFLNPPPNKVFQDKNENSIVFTLEYGKFNFLFTGDLSKEGENRILDKYNLDKIDILKLGHHGSITSTGPRLLDECRPDLAIISVGKNNYGHPDKKVLEKLEQRNINYLRTDKNGAVTIKTNGEQLNYDTFIR